MNSDTLYERLKSAISSNHFTDNPNLSEIALAEEFGVSRTPVRQALFRLVNDNLLIYKKNFGFSLPPLTEQEIVNLYQVIKILELEALRTGFYLLQAQILELKTHNRSFKSATCPEDLLKADEKFHALIAAAANNDILVHELNLLKLRAKRYDLLYYLEKDYLKLSHSQHQNIIAAIQNSDLESAGNNLAANWDFGIQYFKKRFTD